MSPYHDTRRILPLLSNGVWENPVRQLTRLSISHRRDRKEELHSLQVESAGGCPITRGLQFLCAGAKPHHLTRLAEAIQQTIACACCGGQRPIEEMHG